MKIIVRKAEPRDSAGVCAILNPIIRAGKQTVLDMEFTIEQEENFIKNFSTQGLFLVAELDGKILGLQTIEQFSTYTAAFNHVGIMGTYVQNGFRRMGIGRKLFSKLCKLAPDLGYKKIFTYILADNIQSINFYSKLGFRIVGTAYKQAFIKGRYIDEVIVEYFF